MIKKNLFLCILVLLCACRDSKITENEENSLPDKKVDSLKITESESVEKALNYFITVEKIDSIAFFEAQKTVSQKQKKIEKITDFPTAKKLLAGVVEFNDGDEDGESHAVRKINFRNGTKWGNTNDFDGEFFIAYFPTEDILLCEGGHTTDVSFNLKNGKLTEETGNPDEISTSPSEKFRLNGHFGGQECFSYFLQKNNNGEYEKIIQLDEEFMKITKHWLCTIGESFWTDDSTLFVTETNFAAENGKAEKKYFKIILKR